MSFLLFVLWVVSLIFVVKKAEQLTARIEKLENTLDRLTTPSTGRDSSVSMESAAAETEPESPVPPPPEEMPAEQFPSAPLVQDATYYKTEEDSLSDLVLPDEEAATGGAGKPPYPEPVTTEEPVRPEPSQWHVRWQSFKDNVDWEQFTGVKLFAWLGGLALFIAAGFFVKFSIDRNLIPPALRLAVSAVIGIALVIAAGRFSTVKYRVMRHTLAAAGIGVLYSVVFAATLYYVYLTKPLGFGLLVVISAAAFVLAVFYRSRAVSLLGALGAYATPVLVSMGQGGLEMLFGYLAVVNIGLYLVARRLSSQGLLLAAALGTSASLGLGTWNVFENTHGAVIAATWILNLAQFAFFLGHSNADPKENQSTCWTGILVFLDALAVAVILLAKPSWPCLLMMTAALAAAVGLACRNRGWYGFVIPYAALGFLATLAWVLFRFEPDHFTIGFILLLLYGAFGGLGPLVLVWRYGVNRTVLSWFRIFPSAVVLVSLIVVFQQPMVSFWLWPVLFGLVLIGIGISVLIRAFIQIGLLVAFFLAGALNWIFHAPVEMLGIGFFLFALGAGIILCAALFLLIRRLPDLMPLFKLDMDKDGPPTPLPSMPTMTQWMAAMPAAGVCVLLAASFLIKYPHYPHPGMMTLVCFVFLVLFAVRRLEFEISGLIALIGAAGAQAVFVFSASPVYFSALAWSGALFLAALAVPLLFFQPIERWRRIWNGWAVFESLQAVFILFAGQRYWTGPVAQWMPLALAVLKLPLVAVLLRRLEGRPHRNEILAFHGGVLLFYISALPVLVLDHGWIGLTFVFESGALLWLNRRIEHPGLRWVSLCMAPLGLAIVFINLPVLKTVESLPVINCATLSVAAAVICLALSVRPAGHPGPLLGKINLPACFLWYAVATGFLLVNLVVADVFAPTGECFAVWPGSDFLQWACYALSWIALGGLLWRLTGLPGPVRKAGLGLVIAGAAAMIVLPVMLPEAVAHMRPFFNIGTAVYLPVLAGLYFLFHKQPWDEYRSLVKNLYLALFLIAGAVFAALQKATVFATGYPFSLFTSQTPADSAVQATAWMLFGVGLLVWPKRLDRPFRLAGLLLIFLALFKALLLPFRFRVAFGQMTPLLNAPTMVYLLCLAVLIVFTLRKWDQRWPLPDILPKAFWGIVLAVAAFCMLNIEIASAFAIKGRPFSMMTHGSLAMQLAYSISWLLFAIGMLVVGIRWRAVKVRWAAIVSIALTACKIFILDVSSLGQLYRVASLLGLAVVLILVSFLYQRFLSEGKKDA